MKKKPAMAGFEQTDFLLPYVGMNRIKFKGSDTILSVFRLPQHVCIIPYRVYRKSKTMPGKTMKKRIEDRR